MRIYKEIEKCFPEIEKYFSAYNLKEFTFCAYTRLSEYHLSLGVWIRNNILIEGGSLYKHFVEIGIPNKDDMSVIVIELFNIHLREKHLLSKQSY